ncbi:MAG: neutral zinc metallopeptidase [Sphingomonas sp.]|uniref:KPN_02809 family neutral zinc metallopeptidase n=1 Tax=Sphingomonas sp. TaxID=28214 RepID=UPI00183E1EA3|nr:neutral zinc metallopeptidase [Sphingomonas sp.]MBA3667438.1 neutral zinc metallopeptidase [Sphingomonas sp.]
MRLGDAPESGNFEDRTGQSGGGMNLGGGLFGMLIPFVISRFGIVGILILGLGYCALSSLGGGGLLSGGGTATNGESRLTAEQRRVLIGTLVSTEKVWGDIFRQEGQAYAPTRMVAYTSGTQSGCGAAQAAMGPFYCPTDQRIYIDPRFFDELTRRFGAPGDFAQAYVVAHEVGHHVQDLNGTLGTSNSNQQQVAVELQADCYAGVWAARSGGLEAGDIEEGMRAAEAIGDDTLQRKTQGAVIPESFTHGTSAQRIAALRNGLNSGNPSACNLT